MTVNITRQELVAICDRHDIHPKYQPAFWKLATTGKITDRQFGLRLTTCLNYGAACREIEEHLSRELRRFFIEPLTLEECCASA